MAELSYSSQMMKNQKHCDVMSPEKDFKVYQSDKGYAFYFSIGTDNSFYVTGETSGKSSGWKKKKLSDSLSSFHGGKEPEIKLFDVSQNSLSGNIDIAAIANDGKNDFLYISQNNSDSDTKWIDNFKWEAVPYDHDKSSGIKIVNVYIAQSGHSEYIVADILKDPDKNSDYINRFYIDMKKKQTGKFWNPHDISGNLEASGLISRLGRKAKEHIDGIYTLGEISGKKELIYTPLYNYYDPEIPANPTRLSVPDSAVSIDIAVTDDNNTALFVAGGGRLHYYPSDKQQDGSKGEVILEHELLNDTKKIIANCKDNKIIVWGINSQGQIFYTECDRENASGADNWQTPVPVQEDIVNIACYINNNSIKTTLFAKTRKDSLIKMHQQEQTGLWKKENILLPGTDIKKYSQLNTYTTQIALKGDDGLPLNDTELEISASGDSSVYINNAYYRLSSKYRTKVKTDTTGSLTLMQESASVGCVCYKIHLKDSKTDEISINPMDNVFKKIDQVKTADDLEKIEVKDNDGKTKPLVPSDVSLNDKQAAVKSLSQFMKISSTLPSDGSLKTDDTSLKNILLKAKDFKATEESLWGVSFDDAGFRYVHGEEAMEVFSLVEDTNSGLLGIKTDDYYLESLDGAIWSTAGDILNWIRHEAEKVAKFFVQEIKGIYHFFVEIGGKLYRFVMKCLAEVADAVEFIFNKIKVLFEDLVKWLGYIFDWDNILKVKKLFETIAAVGKKEIIYHLDNCEDKFAVCFDALRGSLFKNLKDMDKSNEIFHKRLKDTSDFKKKPAQVKDFENHPENHWLMNHVKANHDNAIVEHKSVDDLVNQVLGILESVGESEVKIIENAIKEVIENVLNDSSNLSVLEIIERITEIGFEELLNTFENISLTIVDAFKIVVEIIWTILNTEIDIPVITPFYENVIEKGEGKLTFLDLTCLLSAIPVGAGFKLIEEIAGLPEIPDSVLERAGKAESIKELMDIFMEKIPEELVKNAMPEIFSDMKDKQSLTWFDYVNTAYQFANALLYTGKLFGDIPQFTIDQSPTPVPGNFLTKLKTVCGALQLGYTVFSTCVYISRKLKMTVQDWILISLIAGLFLLLGFNAIQSLLANGIVIALIALVSILISIISCGYYSYKLIALIVESGEYKDKDIVVCKSFIDISNISQNFALACSNTSLAINKYSSYVQGEVATQIVKAFVKGAALEIIVAGDSTAIVAPPIRGFLYLYEVMSGYNAG